MNEQDKRRSVDTFPDLKKDSSLRGTTKRATAPFIPPTKIPEQYHVKHHPSSSLGLTFVRASGTPSTDPDLKSEYDERTKQWKTTVFPSLKPGGRQEVLLLDKWLNDMLAENLAKNLEPIDSVKEAQELYSTCFHEICRQVHVQCAERGKLMEKIWNRYLQLFDHILKIREREKFSQTQKLEQQKMVYQKLYKEKDEKFNKAYLQLAADKEKITMSRDKLERAVLVLQEEYKKKVQQEQAMKKALKKMQTQLSRQQFMSSLSNHSSESLEVIEDNEESPKANEEEQKKRVRIDEGTDGSPKRIEYEQADSLDLVPSVHSTDSLGRYEEEEEETTEDNPDLLSSVDIDFSNSNLILINKLEQITNGLRLIHKKIDAHGDWDDAYAVTQQMGSVLEAVVDVVSRLEHPDHVREPKSNLLNRESSPRKNREEWVEKALSTLSALRAPIDKAVQTMELEVNEAIPKPYASYFAKSFRVKRYTQKIVDDEELQVKNIARPSLPQYLYELFLRLFGMRSTAEIHLLDFLSSLRRYTQQHLRVKMFARFACIGDDDVFAPYTSDDLQFYLYVLSQFRPHQGKTLPNDPNVPIIRESKDGNSILALKTAISTIHVVFPDIEASAKESLIRVVESCSQVAENDGSTSVVDMDKYLEVLLEEYHLRSNMLSQRFQRTLEDNLSAPLPDLLLYDEFMMCLNSFCGGVSESETMAMYREILESSSLDSVEVKTVLDVVRRHDLFCWKSYSSKIDKFATDFYLLQFLELVWENTKLDLQERLKKIQSDSAVLPRVSAQLQDRVRNFQTALTSNSARAAMSNYRQLVVQIFFASKKQNRLTSGESTTFENTSEDSPPPSP